MTHRKVIEHFLLGQEANGSSLRSIKREVNGWPLTILYSYDEPIAVLNPVTGISLSRHDYSVTTNKHLGQLRRAFVWQRSQVSRKEITRSEIRRIAGEVHVAPAVRRVGHATFNSSGRRLYMGEGGPAPACA